MDKFGRNYELKIGTQNSGVLSITLPFTIEFDITRNTLTSANVCQVRLFNLSKKNRNLIRFNISDYGTYRPIRLTAGYGPLTGLPVIFQGNISAAWSVREGVNFITQIECYDGGFAFNNGQTSTQFPAGINQKDAIAAMAATLPNITPGVIGAYPGQLSRGNAYSGSTTDILGELTGGGFFIDKEKFNALGTDEYIGNVPNVLVDAKSGLLGTPVLEQTIVRFDMLFEPSLNAGCKATLHSLTESNFDGDYKITAVKHRGVISDAVCGSAITTGEFFYSKILTPVNP